MYFQAIVYTQQERVNKVQALREVIDGAQIRESSSSEIHKTCQIFLWRTVFHSTKFRVILKGQKVSELKPT